MVTVKNEGRTSKKAKCKRSKIRGCPIKLSQNCRYEICEFFRRSHYWPWTIDLKETTQVLIQMQKKKRLGKPSHHNGETEFKTVTHEL
jgi:hypothetical protein